MPAIAILGPQRLRPTVGTVADRLHVDGLVAVVTAGWEEREGEDDELTTALGRETTNLALYARWLEVMRDDAELADAWLHRQEDLERERALYRLRLAHALDAARELLRRQDDDDALLHHQFDAIESVRRLDEHHVATVRDSRRAFEDRWRPHGRPAVARHRDELTTILAGTNALALAGGHVGILLDQLRLFGVVDLAGTQPILAWSAGAMVLADRVVLFHDWPPQGPGDAEVHDEGLGLCPDIIPLPHARRRLRLGDAVRVELFARRFRPRRCLALEDGASVMVASDAAVPNQGARRLMEDGRVVDTALQEPAA